MLDLTRRSDPVFSHQSESYLNYVKNRLSWKCTSWSREQSSEKRLSCGSKAALIGEIGASAAAVLEKWNELKPTKMTLNSYWEKASKAGKAELIWASGSTDTGSSLQQHKQKLFQCRKVLAIEENKMFRGIVPFHRALQGYIMQYLQLKIYMYICLY